MSDLPQIEGISVVLLGAFNPAIFHPEWFARQELIPEPDLKDSHVEVVTRELTLVNIGAIRLIAQPERLQLETTSLDLLPVVRDLALGTLQYLAHTPVASMGFNRHLHFQMASAEQWHMVGHALTPKDVWNGLVDDPGMLGVHIEGKRPGASSKYVRIQVQPSSKVQPGVYIGTNEHYEASKAGPEALSELLGWLRSDWDDAQHYGRTTAVSLLGRCLDGEQ